jgi:hypothetical protein
MRSSHQTFSISTICKVSKRGAAAHNRQIHSAGLMHRLDARYQHATLTDDRPNAILLDETRHEATHASTGGSFNADLLVTAVRQLSDAGRGMETDAAPQIGGRRDTLIENRNLCCIANSKNRSVDAYRVFQPEFSRVLFAQWRLKPKIQGVGRHERTCQIFRPATGSWEGGRLRWQEEPALHPLQP